MSDQPDDYLDARALRASIAAGDPNTARSVLALAKDTQLRRLALELLQTEKPWSFAELERGVEPAVPRVQRRYGGR